MVVIQKYIILYYFLCFSGCFASTFLWYLQKEDIIIKEQLINEQINLPSVRLVSDNNEQLGIMSSEAALEIADERNLDLVLISPSANPPVCRLMNYGKYKFEQAKRLKEQKRAQKVAEVKEIQLSMTIEKHDIDVRIKQARKFFASENKVRVTIKMRGRQQARPEAGIEIMKNFYEQLSDCCIMDTQPEILGKNIIMVLSPKK